VTIRRAWTFEVDGRILNAFTIVAGGLAICQYVPYVRNAARVVTALGGAGKPVWTADWPYIENYFTYDGSLYLGGSHARRADVLSGRLLAERPFEDDVTILPPIDSGPVYSSAGRIMGLAAEDLSTAWEVPDPDEELVVDNGRLCRYTADGLMSHIDLTTLEESPPVQAPRPPSNGAALHTHVGDVWCLFYISEGGRWAIDEKSGEVLWHDDQPGGHGLAAFAGDRAYTTGEGGVSAYDLISGRRVWHQPCGPQPRALCSGPRLEAGRIYAGTRDRLVCVIDAGSGGLLLDERVDVEPEAVRPLGDGHLIVGSAHAIHCYELV
jgi:outer membrane protein assembly factor BamB